MKEIIFYPLIVFFLSLTGTYLFKKSSLTRLFLDYPNDRSSHTKATPKGGGIIFAGLFLGAVFFIHFSGDMAGALFLPLFFGGIIIAACGLMADKGYQNVYVRLTLQAFAAILGIYSLGPLTLNIAGNAVHLNLAGYIFSFLCLMWLTNLYNFMDGIDGIAAIEAITVLVPGAALFLFAQNETAYAAIYLAAAIGGFLVWNYPRAGIFMGDAGSGFLGYTLAVFMLFGNKVIEGGLWIWFILMGSFIVDATVTLIRRLADGSRWNVAHRRHAYQHAAARWGHSRTSAVFGFINVVWLSPIAFVTYKYPDFGLILCAGAWLPLLILAFLLNAGRENP